MLFLTLSCVAPDASIAAILEFYLHSQGYVTEVPPPLLPPVPPAWPTRHVAQDDRSRSSTIRFPSFPCPTVEPPPALPPQFLFPPVAIFLLCLAVVTAGLVWRRTFSPLTVLPTPRHALPPLSPRGRRFHPLDVPRSAPPHPHGVRRRMHGYLSKGEWQ